MEKYSLRTRSMPEKVISREGSTARFFVLDCVNNGDQNFVVWDLDILEKTGKVRVYPLL